MIKRVLFFISVLCFWELEASVSKEGFSKIAKHVVPSIVSVSVIKRVNDTNALKSRLIYMLQSPKKDLFGQDVINPPKKVGTSGSGFVIDPDGYIVTNYHVVEDAVSIKVITHDEEVSEAELVGYDAGTDLAVLKVSASKRLKAIEWADSSKAAVGEWVIAVGNPFGLGTTLTSGVISSSSRDLDDPILGIEEARLIQNFIQTDAAINRGNSGGPLVNTSGKVVGVNFAMVSSSGGSDGVGLAIPSNSAKKITKSIIRYGRVRRAWFGVGMQAVTKEMAENLGLSLASGAIVVSTTDAGPAEKAGIQKGDVLLEVSGKKVKDAADVTRIVEELSVGETVGVMLWRNKEKMRIQLKLEELQTQEDYKATLKTKKIELKDHVKVDVFDFGITSLTGQFRQRFGAENREIQGVFVSDVDPAGWGIKYGFSVGDIIMEVNQQSVDSVSSFKQAIDAALLDKKPVLFFVYKGGFKLFIAIPPKKD